MSVKNFKFVSPGVFINEIDNSFLPKTVDAIGPVVVGRASRGLAMQPVKVESYSAFVLTSLVSGVVQQLSKLGQNDFLMVADDPSGKIISGLLTINLVFAVLSTQ